MKPQLLCFALSPTRKGKMTVLCTRLGIRLRPVREEQYGLTLAAILEGGTEPLPAPEGETVGEETYVMCGFPDGLVNAFYAGMKAARLPLPALMASLTETNAGWTPPALYRELSAEREAFRAGKSAHGEE